MPLARKENDYPTHEINQRPAVFLHRRADPLPQSCEVSTYESCGKICRISPLSSTKTEYLVLYDGQQSGFTSQQKEQGVFFVIVFQ